MFTIFSLRFPFLRFVSFYLPALYFLVSLSRRPSYPTQTRHAIFSPYYTIKYLFCTHSVRAQVCHRTTEHSFSSNCHSHILNGSNEIRIDLKIQRWNCDRNSPGSGNSRTNFHWKKKLKKSINYARKNVYALPNKYVDS